jgi:hypothetical protein
MLDNEEREFRSFRSIKLKGFRRNDICRVLEILATDDSQWWWLSIASTGDYDEGVKKPIIYAILLIII